MPSNNWLTTSANTLISLGSNSDFLSHLLDIEDEFSAFRGLGYEDLFDVLSDLIKGDAPKLEKALKDLGIDAGNLRAQGKRFQDILKRNGQDAEELKYLLASFSDLKNQYQDTTPPERVWPLLDEAASRQESVAEGVTLKLDTSVGLKLVLQALAELPVGVSGDQDRPWILRLGAAGALSAGAGVDLSRGAVKVGLSASASDEAAVDFYFRHPVNTRRCIGDALVMDLGRLTSPFSVTELSERLLGGNLAAVRFQAKHEAGISGKVVFGQDFQVSELVSGKAGVEFGFSRSLSGEFHYLITAGADGNLVITMKRQVGHKEQRSASWGLSVDLSKWAEQVYPQIQKQLGELDKALDGVKGFVPGQGAFRAGLSKALSDALGDFAYKEQVLQGLVRVTGGKDLGDSLEQALLERIESLPELWKGEAEERAARIKAELINRLPVAVDVGNALDAKLDQALKQGLADLDAALENELKKLVDGRGFSTLAKKLNALGNRIKRSIDDLDERVDAVTGPIREALDQVQQRIVELKGLFNDASKAKIAMNFSTLHQEEDSDAVDLGVVLDPRHKDAQAVLNELVTADLDRLFDRFVDSKGRLDFPEDGPIVTATGTFTRYAAVKDETGFALVLFGHGLSGKTTISGDAKLVLDAHGNIQVLTKGEFKKQYKSLNDERELQIVDTVELAAAGRSVGLAVNLSLTDEALAPAEARAFLDSAEKVGLLAPGTADSAAARLSGTNLQSARLDVGMTLSKEQVLRLLCIDKPDGGLDDQPALDAERIFTVARENMVEVCTLQPPSDSLLGDLQTLRDEIPGLGSDLDAMIAGMTRKQWERADGKVMVPFGDQVIDRIHAESALSWVRARYVAVKGCHKACSEGSRNQLPFEVTVSGRDWGDTQNEQSGLLDALDGMRKVYFSQAGARKWNVKTLRKRQSEIAAAFKPWFLWQADIEWWLLNTKKIRPLTLAFFRTLGELAQPEGEARPVRLSAALTLKGSKGEDKQRIALT